MLRQFISNLDLRAGKFCSLNFPAYIREQYLSGGKGVYSQEEWSRTRTLGYRGAGRESENLDSDARYVQRMLSDHSRNVLAALRLVRTVDFSRYESVLEIGCGEMIQAFVLKCNFPSLRVKATDFDPYIINKCSRLPLLNCLEKEVLDAGALSAEQVRGFKLLMCWEVLYALDDEKVLAILRAAASAGAPFLACTTQMTGPARQCWRALKNLNWRPDGFYYKRLERAGAIRMHGWTPSAGYYDRLAARAGMRLTRAWHPPAFGSQIDNFSYLLFTPKRL
jgi:trans-aconitate methyltransferase